MNKAKSILGKIVKGFIAGGVASVTVSLSQGYSISSIAEATALLKIIATGFITGGFLAAIKYTTWSE